MLQGFAPGALTEQPLSERANAGVAVTLAEEMGVYGFKPNVMDDIIAGKRVSLRSSIQAFWRTLGGDISPLDIDIAMQMIYKMFTSEVCSLTAVCVCVVCVCADIDAGDYRCRKQTELR